MPTVLTPTAATPPLTFNNLRDIFDIRFKGHELEAGMRDYYLNEAYMDFCNECRFGFKLARQPFTLSSGAATVTLPTGVWDVLAVKNTDNDYNVRQIEGYTNPDIQFPDNDETGPPRFFRMRGQTEVDEADTPPLLEFFPKADTAYNLSILLVQSPTPLDEPLDQPLVPRHYRHALVNGALARAYVDNAQSEPAALCQEIFNNAVRQARAELQTATAERYPGIVDDFWEETY